MKKPDPSEDGTAPRPRAEWHGKPYNFFGDYLQHRYHTRVLKLPLDAHLSCPNRDGTLGDDGCVFCRDGSASPGMSDIQSIAEQMRIAKGSFRRADGETRFISYLQAYTNTYAPLQQLKDLYDRAIADPEVIGLMIGTRPDCCPDEVLDLIETYRRKDFELWIELGMQTTHDRSLRLLNRRHTFEHTVDAVDRITKRRIPVCLHCILGIPGETWEDMMRTASTVASLPVQGVKLHHLHVIRGTRLEELHEHGRLPLLSQRDYVSTVCDFIERLPGDVLIHRLMGDREESTLVAPTWGLHKGTVMRDIDDMFSRRGTHQGFLAIR
ncbi:MAG TPA: TIGR01212 family radical SAM protein [Spirochaetota bacterium]|nr:TIGR01212 family radical SAM protein [Spirochaetota bacterium]HNT10800.1 TIGR01212 family radical SAM protein [Spirochaetota bacterium]